MKLYKTLFLILIIFLKTGNVLSSNDIFNVNNIELKKTYKLTNDELASQAIKKGFKQLMKRILLDDDAKKLLNLKYTQIKELVKYYQISNKSDELNNQQNVSYNITFDKDKVHDLFYKKDISYSEIHNKELFLLPVFQKENRIFIYNQNFFYNNWNAVSTNDLLEFIIPLENIEIIQNINSNRDNLLDLKLTSLFEEYTEKNLALVLIEDNNNKEEMIYFKTRILGKNIVKNISIKRFNLSDEEFYKKIIISVKQEIVNVVKSQNLIDIRVPSFLNVKFKINKKNNLIELRSRLKNVDFIENIYVQKFNNEFIYLKIKYLGKIDKIINQLENQKVILKYLEDEWSLKII